MRDRPEGITERDVARALADGWGLAAWTLEYAPVGGGSYLNELLEIAGARNVYAGLPQPSPTVSFEDLLRWRG